jgi:enoyl-CoA hydratase
MPQAMLQVEREGRVMTVRLVNPPRNFMTGRMVLELEELVAGLEGDGSIGAVVLTGGVDGVFITHFDVAEILAASQAVSPAPAAVTAAALRAAGAIGRIPGGKDALGRTPAAGLVELRRIHDLFLAMNRSDKVFLAAINGLAMGGGFELALACDVRYMTADPDARVGLPEITVGIIPGAGGTQRLARLVGAARAKDLVYSGRFCGAEESRSIGLVDQVHQPDEVYAKAVEAAARYAKGPGLALRAAKQAIDGGLDGGLDAGLLLERHAFQSLFATEDAAEGMRSFQERGPGKAEFKSR